MCAVCDGLKSELVEIIKTGDDGGKMEDKLDAFQKEKELNNLEMARFTAAAGIEAGIISPSEGILAIALSWEAESNPGSKGT